MEDDPMCWHYLERYDQHWLKVDGREVALISKRVPGDWLVHVNRHQEWKQSARCSGVSPTVPHGKKMAERWARVNLDRLRAEIAALPRRAGLPSLPVGEPTVWIPEPPEPTKCAGKPRRRKRRR